jgi:phenylacetate-CoA ligase
MTEVGPVSYSTAEQPTLLRLMHHRYICEVLRPGTDTPVAPGESGELVLTNLGREACPLLRYRTGDLVRPVVPSGEDPAHFALEGGILGRVDDMVIVRGVNLYPAAIDAVIRGISGIGEYQVEIDKRPTLPEVKIRFETTNESDDPTAELSKHLRATFQIRIEVEKVSSGVLPVFEFKAKRWKILQ